MLDIYESVQSVIRQVKIFQNSQDYHWLHLQYFAFLNTTGEIVADELPGSVKILVLTEMMSRCIGYVVVGEDVEADRRQIFVWLQHFGLTSKAILIDVHTDSERAVGEIIGNSLVATRSPSVEPHPSSIVQLEQLRGQSGN